METSTLTDRVYDELRRRILRHEWANGERLKISSLARTLHVSNTPVREAINRLEKTGLVNVIPYRGICVRSLSPQEVADVFDVRIALEELSARLAAERGTPEAVGRIEAVHCAYERALREDDHTSDRSELSRQFHLSIALASENRALIEIFQGVLDRSRLLWRAGTGLSPGSIPTWLEFHRRVLEAIQARDPERAAAAIRQDVIHTKELLLSRIAASLGEN